MASQKPRISLSKAQAQVGVGAELLALCQSVTEDGSLSNDEIAALRTWLEANRASDLPAIGFLVATLERILADGKVIKDETVERYKAIEKVLPPEARKEAQANRKTVEAEENAKAREEKEAQKQQKREEKERNRRIMSANFIVAGVHYEGRGTIIDEFVNEDDLVFLARDRNNRFSRNAIKIRLHNGFQIGFLPEVDAVDWAPYLDDGCPHLAYVTKILTGGRTSIPVVQAYLYGKEATVDGLVFPHDVPAKRAFKQRAVASNEVDFGVQTPARTQKTGCLGLTLLAMIPIVAGIVVALLPT
jgi:HIRAN domain